MMTYREFLDSIMVKHFVVRPVADGVTLKLAPTNSFQCREALIEEKESQGLTLFLFSFALRSPVNPTIVADYDDKYEVVLVRRGQSCSVP